MNYTWIICFILTSSIMLSCLPAKNKDINGGQGNGSGLSTIAIALPDKAKIATEAGKENAREKLTSFRLIIEPLSNGCSNAKVIEFVGAWKSASLNQKIQKDCDYSIGLELGDNASEITTETKKLDVIYFSNWKGTKTGERLSATQQDKVSITLKLALTEEGKKVGFIGDTSGTVTPSGETDLSVEVSIQNDGTTPPSENPSQDNNIYLYKADQQEGVKEPVYLMHKSHGLEVSNGSKIVEKDYCDLWLATVLTDTLRKLKAQFNLKGITHMGIYVYRNIAGTSTLSRHSYALAIDLSTFILKDGTKITLEDDWNDESKGATLRAIEDVLKQSFSVVLDPDYNEDHYNHFHIDLSPDKRPSQYPLLASKGWDDIPESISLLLWGRDHDRVTVSSEGDEGMSLWDKK